MTLIDFNLSNARRFYSSMGNPLAVKGLKTFCSNSKNCCSTGLRSAHFNSPAISVLGEAAETIWRRLNMLIVKSNTGYNCPRELSVFFFF